MEQRNVSEEREVSILLTVDPYDLTNRSETRTPGPAMKIEPKEEEVPTSALLQSSGSVGKLYSVDQPNMNRN